MADTTPSEIAKRYQQQFLDQAPAIEGAFAPVNSYTPTVYDDNGTIQLPEETISVPVQEAAPAPAEVVQNAAPSALFAAQGAAPQAESYSSLLRPREVAPIPLVSGGSPSQQLQLVDAALVDNMNQRMDVAQDVGEIKALESQESARLRDDEIRARMARYEELEKSTDDRKSMMDKIELNAVQDYNDLRKPIIDDRNWFQKTVSVVAKMVGGMAQAAMGQEGSALMGGLLSAGMQQLDEYVNRSLIAQEKALAAKERGLKFSPQVLETLSKSSKSEAELASKLQANQYGVLEDQLKLVAEQAKSPLERQLATDLQLKVREQGLSFQREAIIKRLAAQQVLGRGSSQTIDQIIMRVNNKTATPKDLKAYEEYLDVQKKLKDLSGGSISEIDRKVKEGGTAALTPDELKAYREFHGPEPMPGRKVAKPEVWATVDAETRRDFGKKEDAVRSIQLTTEQMKADLNKFSTDAFALTEEGRKARARLSSNMAQLIGAYKDKNALGAYDNGVANLMEQMLGDPNSWATLTPTVIQKLQQSMDNALRDQEIMAERIGLEPRSYKPELKTEKTTPDGRPVLMTGPKGERKEVHPLSVPSYERLGWKTKTENSGPKTGQTPSRHQKTYAD